MASFCCDPKLTRIIVLGLAFMFLFSAFQTCSMVEKSVLDGAKKESNGTFQGNGYISLATVYAVFAVSNWATPSVVSVLGPILSMIIGGICYLLFVVSFFYPMTGTLYAASVIVGIGAALIWTGQGTYLTINSDATTISRNSGIFWALLQASLFIGNLYVYFVFGNEATIDSHSRMKLFFGLTAVAVIGVILFIVLSCLRSEGSDYITLSANLDNSQESPSQSVEESSPSTNDGSTLENSGPLKAFVRSLHLFITPDMMLLSVAFFYTGLELTYFSGVYGTMAGNTLAFGVGAKSYIGLIGVFIGVGEIIGGASFGIFGKRTIKYGREPIVLFGFILHSVSFFLAFLSFPDNAPIEESSESTYITPNIYVIITSGFLLGLGDSSYNTQILSILGDAFKQDSSSAFALFKFIQSLASAAAFFYSTYLVLRWQLLILVVFNVCAVLTFFSVEWRTSLRFSGYGEFINAQ